MLDAAGSIAVADNLIKARRESDMRIGRFTPYG